MSATSKKPPLSVAPGRRTSTDPSTTNTSPSRGSSKSPIPPTTSTSNGIARSPSIRGQPVGARAAARKPGGVRTNLSQTNVPTLADLETEAQAETRLGNAQVIEDLKRQLQKAETTSEQYQKQVEVLQMRLEETMDVHGTLEEQAHDKESKIQALQAESREAARQKREIEASLETDRAMMIREKEHQAGREEELQSTIQRLNESIRQKEMRMQVEGERPNLSRSSSFRNRTSPDVDNGQFAPSAQLERSPSRNNSKLILQKDKLIESLRLELAEAQIKVAEMEHMGDGRLQELEKALMDTRVTNARLMEDNESYQLLLSEKTLKGDFSKGEFMTESATDDRSQGLGSLADELESAAEGESENYKRLEAEARTLRDQNKALTLYIEKIIGRVLQHEGFEHVLDKGDNDIPARPKSANTDKELPPPPPPKDEPASNSFLQRARSVVAGQAARPKPQARIRPVSHMPAAETAPGPTAHEHPDTAPSIPVNARGGPGHRRARSDQDNGAAAAAAVVGQMYRGQPFGRSTSGGPMSPGISPVITPGAGAGTPRQNPYFASASVNASATSSNRNLTAAAAGDRGGSSSNSFVSDHSGGVDSTGTSPPRNSNVIPTAGVMTQSKLRPLRLVQENREMESGDQGGLTRSNTDLNEAARKKANRSSWMGWFNRTGPQDPAAEEEAHGTL